MALVFECQVSVTENVTSIDRRQYKWQESARWMGNHLGHSFVVPYHPAECFYWPQTYALCGKPTLCAFIIFPVFSHLHTPNRSKQSQGLTGSMKHTRGAARPPDISSRAVFILHVRGCPIWLKMRFREFVHTATLRQIITFDDMYPFGKPPNVLRRALLIAKHRFLCIGPVPSGCMCQCLRLRAIPTAKSIFRPKMSHFGQHVKTQLEILWCSCVQDQLLWVVRAP